MMTDDGAWNIQVNRGRFIGDTGKIPSKLLEEPAERINYPVTQQCKLCVPEDASRHIVALDNRQHLNRHTGSST